MIKMGSFRSYVDLAEYEMKIAAPLTSGLLQPNFLPGELVIAEATQVLKFTSLTKSKGLSGSLFVTNARVVFVSSEHISCEESYSLLSVNTLWYYEKPTSAPMSTTKKTKRRVKLGPMKTSFTSNTSPALLTPSHTSSNHFLQSSGSTRIHEIFLVTSNFRTLRVSFERSPIDQALRICNAIMHHTFPLTLERLFYFDFSKAYTGHYTASLQNSSPSRSVPQVPSYFDKGDWLRELNQTRTPPGGYRISGINEGFQLCGSLPEWIVVPSDVNDARVMNLAEKLKGSRPPHWSWGDSRGAAILSMGKLNNEQDSSAENAFFESLRKVHPRGLQPNICDLDAVINLREVRQSFVALVDLCCPEGLSQYNDIDSKFYSCLEHTKWMQLVSKALKKCRECMEGLVTSGNAIIFQEQEGRDMCCLFSSLLQVTVDPRFRTIPGFFSLLQKEWVAFGHPFHSTHLHTSPVFLLFLDCVFQLTNQNPSDFEFNDKLLSSLWDSLFDSTTGTFMFDTPQQRKTMELCKESTAWLSIFSNAASPEGNISPRDNNYSVPRSLLNPLYPIRKIFSSNQTQESPLLASCNSVMCDLSFWEGLYLHRTLEVTPIIVTNSDTHMSEPVTPATSTPSPSSKFYFPLPVFADTVHQKRRPGRDTLHELGVVEALIDHATPSRYQPRLYNSSSSSPRHIPGSSASSRRQSSGSASSPGAKFSGNLSSASTSMSSTPQRPARRQNPFLTSSPS